MSSPPDPTILLASLPRNMNASVESTYPFYYVPRENLLPTLMSDKILTLVVPLVVFWVISIAFDILDSNAPSFLEKYRIHPSTEEASRNRVGKAQVILTVMLQQLIQTLIGFWWLRGEPDETFDPISDITNLHIKLVSWNPKIAIQVLSMLGPNFVPWLYWWGIPALQFLWAIGIIDTWQYALHRLMHTYPFLYKHLHSWHHRLYVPYAYSSLYNHPIEGLLLDIIGSLLSFDLSGMTRRQAMLLFGVATAKTAHDHCGWSLPFDPFQIFFQNNANYHDIHHQTIGIKHNFSQPFFIHWDTVLGTKMTREEMERKKAENKAKAQKSS